MRHTMSHQDRRRAHLIAGAFALAALTPVAARAQEAFDAKSAAHVRTEFIADMDTLHAKITALAKAIPADKYNWCLGSGVRLVFVVLLFVVCVWFFWVLL